MTATRKDDAVRSFPALAWVTVPTKVAIARKLDLVAPG